MQIADSHNDVFYKFRTYDKIINYLRKVESEGVLSLFCAYYSKTFDPMVTLKKIKNRFNFVRTNSKIAIPTIENAWFLTPQNLEEFITFQPFCVGLCHNDKNFLCGGANSTGGITKWGEKVIQELEKANILIDTAHMNRQSFDEFSKLTKKPLFDSHTCFSAVFDHFRNINDEQITKIVDSNGYIGLAMNPDFFSKKSLSIKKIAEVIFWFTENYGFDTLGLGTDFNGIEKYPKGLKGYNDLYKLELELLCLGMKRDNIEKFFYKNLSKKLAKPNFCHSFI